MMVLKHEGCKKKMGKKWNLKNSSVTAAGAEQVLLFTLVMWSLLAPF